MMSIRIASCFLFGPLKIIVTNILYPSTSPLCFSTLTPKILSFPLSFTEEGISVVSLKEVFVSVQWLHSVVFKSKWAKQEAVATFVVGMLCIAVELPIFTNKPIGCCTAFLCDAFEIHSFL